MLRIFVTIAALLLLCTTCNGAVAQANDPRATLNWQVRLGEVASRAVAVDSADGSVYVHDGTDGVLKYRADGQLAMKIGPDLKDATGKVVAKIANATPSGMSVDPLTRFVHISGAFTAHIVDATGDTPVWKGKYAPQMTCHMAFSADGKRLFAAGGRGVGELARQDNGTPDDYTDDTFAATNTVYSAIGQLPPVAPLADARGCTVSSQGRLYVTDLSTGKRPVRCYSTSSNTLEMEFTTGALKAFGCSTDAQGRFWIPDGGNKDSRLVRCYVAGMEVFSFDSGAAGGSMTGPEMTACDTKSDRLIVVGKAGSNTLIQSWSVSVPKLQTGVVSGTVRAAGSSEVLPTPVCITARAPDAGKSPESVCFYSAKDGRFSIELTAGAYRITASAPGCIRNDSASLDCSIRPGEEYKTADIALVPAEQMRLRDRAAYTPIRLANTASARQTLDLSGKWLFKPSHEMAELKSGSDPAVADDSWHVLGIPQFWGVQDWSLAHGTTSYYHYFREVERCGRFTFDYAKTTSGWYRQWVDVPASMKGKRIVLKFAGVAAISQVYWNGKPVGGHVGMFGPFECEVTSRVRCGERNLLAVFVSRGRDDKAVNNEVAEVAVTVKVTKSMIGGMPVGHYLTITGGIWQPVSMEITPKDRIADVYFRPSLTGAVIQTTISRQSSKKLTVRQVIVDSETHQTLYSGKPGQALTAKPGDVSIKQVISRLKPKLWSPEHPNLYKLKTQLLADGVVVDEATNTVGFRTFEARGRRLYLNDRIYFLRGANSPPTGLAPTDRAAALKYMKLLHDGNVMVTRFHGMPVGGAWLEGADQYGVGVSMEGQWSWVCIGNNAIPSKDLLDAWHDEYMEIVRAYRNHPSILMWTVGNENYFAGKGDSDFERKKQKYQVFSKMVKDIRANSPDTPVVFYSGFMRLEDDYEKIVKPNGLDDGDIDDEHCYAGWYGQSLLQMEVVRDLEGGVMGSKFYDKNRPLISQEHGLIYANIDTGHPLSNYRVKATAWIGEKASYRTSRPDYFLETQARMVKETEEKIRRDRDRIGGWLLFSSFNWFQYEWDADTINPYPVYWAAKQALQPILTSIVTPNRHFMAGQRFASDVVVANDDPDHAVLRNVVLEWRIYGPSLADSTSGVVPFPNCDLDARVRRKVEFETPMNVPQDRCNMVLELVLLADGVVVSRNSYPIICASRGFVSVDGMKRTVTVLENDDRVSGYLSRIGLPSASTKSIDWKSLAPDALIVIGSDIKRPQIGSAADFGGFVKSGGRVLMIEPKLVDGNLKPAETVLGAIPDFPADKVAIEPVPGEFVDVQSDKLLDGLDPMDIRWFSVKDGEYPKVCRVSYRVPEGTAGVRNLTRHVSPHPYIPESDVWKCISNPTFEVTSGGGKVLVTSLLLADDPVAMRLMKNQIECLAQ